MRPILIFIAAIIFGLAFHAVTPDFPMHGDTATFYDPIAKNLAEGKGFWLNGEPTARVAPLYPFLLSLIYRAGGGFNEMLILQIFILAGIAVVSYRIARRFMSQNFAFLAALNVSLWPYLLFYSKLVLTEVTFVLFLLIAVYYILIFYEKPTKKTAILLGASLGLATLLRPVILLLPLWLFGTVFIARMILCHRAKRGGIEYQKLLISICVFCLVLLPWTIRNFVQFHQFVPITSGLGASVDRAYVTLDYTEGASRLAPGEAKNFDHVKSRLKNIYLFWNPGAQGSNAELLLDQNKIFNLIFLVYKIIFILTVALATFSYFIHQKSAQIIIALIILYFWVLHIMLYPYPRYTLPIVPLVIILAWSAVYFMYKENESKRLHQLYKF